MDRLINDAGFIDIIHISKMLCQAGLLESCGIPLHLSKPNTHIKTQLNNSYTTLKHYSLCYDVNYMLTKSFYHTYMIYMFNKSLSIFFFKKIKMQNK